MWIYNIKTGKYFQVTFSSKNDHSPTWDAAGNLYYINVGEKIHYVNNKSDYDRITLVIDLNPNFIK